MERGNVRWRTYGGPWEIRIIFSTNVDNYMFILCVIDVVDEASVGSY